MSLNEGRPAGDRGRFGEGRPGGPPRKRRPARSKRNGKAEELRDILPRILARRGAASADEYGETKRAIEEFLGADRSARIRILGIRTGTLTLGVRSAPLKHELETFYNANLLEFLRGRSAGSEIRSIRFRLEA